MSTSYLPLFDDPPPTFDRAGLASRLQALAAERIYVGTSSWKYPGWLGQIYTRERYSTRGRFSQKRFEQQCLEEYAEVFPIVCGDFSFYQFPAPEFWDKLFATAPASLRVCLKVPEDITRLRFPRHARYGARGGQINPSFLNVQLLNESFLHLLAPFRARVPLLILEFGAFAPDSFPTPESFAAELENFLAKLPRTFQFAVELRNPEFLTPAYFSVMREHGVSHVFNAWTRMPSMAEQLSIPNVIDTSRLLVARALLRKARTYEQAVAAFEPYDRVLDPNPEARSTLRELIRHARERRIPAYLFVNNRLEGNAPVTIQSVIHED